MENAGNCCVFEGKNYSDGAVVCMADGFIYECINGKWSKSSTPCDYKPSSGVHHDSESEPSQDGMSKEQIMQMAMAEIPGSNMKICLDEETKNIADGIMFGKLPPKEILKAVDPATKCWKEYVACLAEVEKDHTACIEECNQKHPWSSKWSANWWRWYACVSACETIKVFRQEACFSVYLKCIGLK